MKNICRDYHIHSSISPDASFSMEEMCASAVEKGLEEIAITDHFEFYTKDYEGYAFDERYIENYFSNLKKCKNKFAEKIVIRSGIEYGQPHVNLEKSNYLLKQFQFDFVLGSLHKCYNLDFKNKHYSKATKEEECKQYLEHLYELVSKGDFDCLGHFDLIKRYAARDELLIDLIEYKMEVQQILQCLIKRNKGLEINTSGLRQEAKTTFPSFEIIKMYYELGGEILTVGSDAHRPKDIASDFDLVMDLVLDIGFKAICTFENRIGIFNVI